MPKYGAFDGATPTGNRRHARKYRFPNEALCGVMLDNDRTVKGLGKCPKCVYILAKKSPSKKEQHA